MKRICSFLAIAFAALAFGGCSKDDTRGKDDDRKTWVAFSINSAKPHTYADGTDSGTPAEQNISSVYIVIFKADNGAFEKAVNFDLDASNKLEDKTESISVGQKKFLVYVNATQAIKDYINDQKVSQTPANFSTFRNEIVALTSVDDISSYASTSGSGSFMMTNADPDKVENPTYYETSDKAKQAPISINVQRVVAKIDLATTGAIKMSGIGTTGTIESIDALLYSQNRKSYIFPRFKDQNGLVDNPNYGVTDNFESYFFIPNSPNWISAKTLSGIKIGNVSDVTEPFYCFENSSNNQIFSNTTHITVRVKFTPDGFSSGTFYYKDGEYYSTQPTSGTYKTYTDGYMYYRIYFMHDPANPPAANQKYMIARNNWYKVRLTCINAPGADSFTTPPNTAVVEDGSISFKINIVDWAVRERDVVI